MAELWYEKPALEWEEALPIGNGRLGAMVYGGVDREILQVNEESMWFGGAVNRHNPDSRKNLPVIRELLNKGEVSRAEKLMDEALSGCPEGMHAYQTLGEVQLFFDNLLVPGVKKSGKIGKTTLTQGTEEYRRSLNLADAVCRTGFRMGNCRYEREVFASHPADAILMKVTAKGEGEVSLTARLRRGSWFDGVRKTGENGIQLYGNLGRGGYEFAMELRARAVGGRVFTVGECLRVEGAREVVLYFSADTTYHYSAEEKEEWLRKSLCGEQAGDGNAENEAAETGAEKTESGKERFSGLTEELSGWERREYEYQQALQALLSEKLAERFEKLEKIPYEKLKEEHIRDYRSLYDRFTFEIEGAEKEESCSTEERMQAAKEGNPDVGLSKLLFDFGRYLTIAASRKGGLPTTLQGLWNKDFFPAWDSKYTININTEMNYWHVEQCNLSECHLPLFELLKKVQKNGRYTARQMYGCRGFVAHHNTDIHGDTAPQDTWYPGSYWVMGGAWLSTHLWSHYCYTQDGEFLKEAFPIMADAALFFVDFLIEKDGYLVTSPSVSPENTYILPNGEKGSCCIGATMDNQILRHLFGDCLSAWETLGEKEYDGCVIDGVEDISELMKQIRECRDRLMPDRISKSGRIMEWMEDYEEADPGHRHISHLYGLYPAGQITVDKTPELAAAARKTLEYRLSHGGGHTGWSRAWIMNHYASLWDGKTAYENIKKMLELSTYPNLFDRHPPFQIDGNFGACAAMCRMLAQSDMERVILLPALPEEWANGSVRGLRLAGDAELNMQWQNGELVRAEISAEKDYDTTVIYHGEAKKVNCKAGEKIKLK